MSHISTIVQYAKKHWEDQSLLNRSRTRETSLQCLDRKERVRERTAVFLRSLSLSALGYAVRPANRGTEIPQIALQEDRLTALLRAMVHFLPMAVTITFIALNYVGIYIGKDAPWVPLLQYTAKAVETLLQASIATVAFTYIRHEIIRHDTPFGAVFSAFQIRDVSYLWSLEFWGSLTSSDLRGQRKLLYTTFITFSILLAAVVGPSFAVALIPRSMNFPAGTASLWLDTREQDIFPSNLTTTNIPPRCASLPCASFTGTECPASEWPAIGGMIAIPGLPTWTGLQTTVAEREIWVDETSEESIKATFATTPQSAVADVLQMVGNFWDMAVSNYPYGGNPSKFRSYNNAIHVVDALQPYVITRCLHNAIGSLSLKFPTRQPSWSARCGQWTVANYTVPPASSIETQSYYVRWLDLPRESFPNASIGAIIEPPTTVDAQTDTSRVACTIYAGWRTTTINLTMSSEYIQSSIPTSSSLNAFQWEIDWVSITSEWAAFLTPHISNENTTIDTVLYSQSINSSEEVPSHPAQFHEELLAGLVVNGMARTGFSSGIYHLAENLADSLPNETNRQWLTGSNSNLFKIDPTDPKAGYHLTIVSTVNGLAYSTKNTPIKLAFAALFLYCIYALSHIIYTTISGISSSSWDSIAELTALALASTKSEITKNSTAGITTLEIFREPVRVRAVSDNHLELVFKKDNSEGEKFDRVEVNRKY